MERGRRDRERGKEGGRRKERNIDVREKHPVLAPHVHPNPGSCPQPFGAEGQALIRLPF